MMPASSKGADPRHAELTLLLTDVESSTSLWERWSTEMAEATDQMDAHLHRIVASHSGTLVKSKGEGDSSFAIFENPLNAVLAAGDFQKVLSTEDWATRLSLRVRMGINVGPVLLRSNDYFGPTVNRTARLRGAAHGGQVLLSEELGRRIQDELPQGFSLRDLGLRRLKDLTRPERIYQLVHPELIQSFPPIAALDARAHNLPIQPTEFVGRKKELESIKELLRGRARLLTLTGPPGVGKTRLATQSSADLIDEFEHGVWLVMLAEIQDHSLVPNAIAAAMGIKELPGGSATEALIASLQSQSVLLVLDNFEHLLGAASFVAELLAACPDVKILVTSRSWLNLRAEHHLEVGSLPVPEDPGRLKLEDLGQYDALVLFEQRVASIIPNFRPSDLDVALMARVCARLQGIPLALELAASQMRTRGLDQMLKELDNRLEFLVEGPVDLPARHRALRAAIGWSYDLLAEDDRRLLNHLGVFAGSFDAERVEALAGASRSELDPLIQHHLLATEEERCRLLETVREFALEKLAAAGEEQTIRSRHFEVFLEFSARLLAMISSPQVAESISIFKTWLPDFRAGLEWATINNRPGGFQMALNLHKLWVPVGLVSEGRRWLGEFSKEIEAMPPSDQVAFHQASGWLALTSSNAMEAKSHLERAIALESHGVPGVRAALRSTLGTALTVMGDIAGSKRVFEEALALKDGPAQSATLAHIHNGLGIIASMSSQYDEARGHWEKTRVYLTEIGDLASLGGVLINLASLAFNQGDLEAAGSVYGEAAEVARKIGSLPILSKALNGLGQTATERGDIDSAEELLTEAVQLRRQIEDRQGLGFSLMNLAKVHWRKGRGPEAVQTSDEAMDVAREIGNPHLISSLLLVAGEIRMESGDPAMAARLLVESLQALNSLNDRRGLAVAIELVAGCISQVSPSRNVMVLVGAADSMREEVEAARTKPDLDLITELEARVAKLLSDNEVTAAREEGRSMPTSSAIELALTEAEAIS